MVFEKMCELISEQFGVDAGSITMETSLKENLGADSLDLVELTMAVEEEFEVGEVQDEDLEHMTTVGDIVNFVNRKMGE